MIKNSQKSFLFFLGCLNHHLDINLKNSRINKQIIERTLELYDSIFNSDTNINFVYQKRNNMNISFCLNIIQTYNLLLHQQQQLLISSNSGKTIFDNLVQSIHLISPIYNLPVNFNLDSNKNIIENKNNNSRLDRLTPFFELSKLRGNHYEFIMFDNCTLQNKDKIKDILIEIDSKSIKTVLIVKEKDEVVDNLFDDLKNSIIVNKTKIN